ncbi:MAG: hypothetical protein AAF739_06815 [Pseudomonadota bacterium]
MAAAFRTAGGLLSPALLAAAVLVGFARLFAAEVLAVVALVVGAFPALGRLRAEGDFCLSTDFVVSVLL